MRSRGSWPHLIARGPDMAIDNDRLNAFLGKAVGDLGAAVSAVLVSIGDELGLYRALAKEPMTAGQLAEQTRTNTRYVREWLGNQTAGGYVEHDAETDRYYLTPEQTACLADPAGPVDLPGAYLIVQDLYHIRDRALRNFRTGEGMEWGEHHACLFHGTVLPRRLQQQPDRRLAAGARWRRGEARAGRTRSRCGLRTRREHHSPRQVISGRAIRRLRLPCRLDRHRAQARGR